MYNKSDKINNNILILKRLSNYGKRKKVYDL